jgi:hypothetical protein
VEDTAAALALQRLAVARIVVAIIAALVLVGVEGVVECFDL